MSPQIGKHIKKEPLPHILERAKLRSSLLPDLLSEAKRIVSNVISGWHGCRKRGIGENFWQFRPYTEGEDFSKIDWRRSARDDNTYVKDLEWEAVHTFWVWSKLSPSMDYQSNLSKISKQSRALVLGFAVVELLARSGERIGWPSISKSISARNASEQLAFALAHHLDNHENGSDLINAYWPDITEIKPHSQMVIISDFLDPIDDLIQKFDELFARGVKAYLIHIVDPAEQIFPYAGRTEFYDPVNGERFTAANAKGLKEQYQHQFEARIEMIKAHVKKMGWGYQTHHTDRATSFALVTLHGHLTGNFEMGSKLFQEVN